MPPNHCAVPGDLALQLYNTEQSQKLTIKKLIMADDDVATKAPESDAQEKSVFPGDTPAQEGPTLGASLRCP